MGPGLAAAGLEEEPQRGGAPSGHGRPVILAGSGRATLLRRCPVLCCGETMTSTAGAKAARIRMRGPDAVEESGPLGHGGERR
jgi:hypothetical protein